MALLFLFHLLFFLFFTALVLCSSSDVVVYRIDCGSPINSTDKFNSTWISDRFYTGGSNGLVSEPLMFQQSQEKTLRFFPVSSGKKNCYVVPVPDGRYFIRTFTVYDNYDGKSQPPSFDVSVEATQVFSWRSPWQEEIASSGAYSDLFAFVRDGEADVCFYSIATDSPVIASLEVVQVDTESYESATVGNNSILVNYGRLTCGSDNWGPGFSNDTDFLSRSWQSDEQFRSPGGKGIHAIYTNKTIVNADRSPNYFPMKLYQTAISAVENGVIDYELPVDAKSDYLVWLHFAEIDETITKQGQRVFDVVINGNNLTRIDIIEHVGSFAAFSWHYIARNLTSTSLTVQLFPVIGAPLLCGLENYAIVPADTSTPKDQVAAMRALKDSLNIPARMGWNGDPCAPPMWDAWEGVTCHSSNNNVSSLVSISQIDASSQGLKGGFISDKIGLLSDLVSLNLSSNSLGGTLPSDLGHKSLVKLDLSKNKFTGSIPYSLPSTNLQLVLLNDNLLEGRVPEELYSVGVHGGVIDLTGNKDLCGVPPLQDCPILWGKQGLSTAGKIGVAILSVFLCCLILLGSLIYVKRRRNDYDFSLPHDLASIAAKRNRYQRQKSLMALELESQHAKGFIPNPDSRVEIKK